MKLASIIHHKTWKCNVYKERYSYQINTNTQNKGHWNSGWRMTENYIKNNYHNHINNFYAFHSIPIYENTHP